jgi:hypothetical protein
LSLPLVGRRTVLAHEALVRFDDCDYCGFVRLHTPKAVDARKLAGLDE